MAILVGKVKLEVICPLCGSIWLLDQGEYSYGKDPDESTVMFHCYECDREINVPSSNVRDTKYRTRGYISDDPIYYKE